MREHGFEKWATHSQYGVTRWYKRPYYVNRDMDGTWGVYLQPSVNSKAMHQIVAGTGSPEAAMVAAELREWKPNGVKKNGFYT